MAGPQGRWVQTASGRRVWPLYPCDAHVCVEDLAHHLAQEPRYGGAAPWPYSVAQHSVLVARRAFALALARPRVDEAISRDEVARVVGRQALLHDGAEAYLKDIPRPFKAELHLANVGIEYVDLEAAWQDCIWRQFRCPALEQPEVRQADEELLATEAAVLFPVERRAAPWNLQREPLPDVVIARWGFEEARATYLETFAEMGGRSYC